MHSLHTRLPLKSTTSSDSPQNRHAGWNLVRRISPQQDVARDIHSPAQLHRQYDPPQIVHFSHNPRSFHIYHLYHPVSVYCPRLYMSIANIYLIMQYQFDYITLY